MPRQNPNKRVLVMHRGGLGGVRGTEVCIAQSIEALHRRGFEVIFARNLPVIDELVAPFVSKIIPFEFSEILINGIKSKIPLKTYLQGLRKLLREARSLKPSLFYASGGLPCQLCIPAGKILGIPTLCHLHHPASRKYYRSWLVEHANECIFPSDFTQSDVQSKTKVTGKVVYNGVDIDRFQPTARDESIRDDLGIAKDKIVMGQVGHLNSNKRPLFLLSALKDALQKNPRLHLCLVGKGPLEAELHRAVKEAGLENAVTITGYVDDVLPFYQHVFDINALASSEEGLGISILEGAACGLPSVIANNTGLKETTIHEKTGLVFDTDNQSELVDALLTLASNKELRSTFGTEGRSLVNKQFSKKNYANRVIDIAEQLIQKDSSQTRPNP